MGKFKLKIEELAQIHLKKHFKSGHQPRIKKIEKILLKLIEIPYSGIENSETFKNELVGFWSHRIHQKDRLILATVFIISLS